jgi:hypothetical protein
MELRLSQQVLEARHKTSFRRRRMGAVAVESGIRSKRI